MSVRKTSERLDNGANEDYLRKTNFPIPLSQENFLPSSQLDTKRQTHSSLTPTSTQNFYPEATGGPTRTLQPNRTYLVPTVTSICPRKIWVSRSGSRWYNSILEDEELH